MMLHIACRPWIVQHQPFHTVLKEYSWCVAMPHSYGKGHNKYSVLVMISCNENSGLVTVPWVEICVWAQELMIRQYTSHPALQSCHLSRETCIPGICIYDGIITLNNVVICFIDSAMCHTSNPNQKSYWNSSTREWSAMQGSGDERKISLATKKSATEIVFAFRLPLTGNLHTWTLPLEDAVRREMDCEMWKAGRSLRGCWESENELWRRWSPQQ